MEAKGLHLTCSCGKRITRVWVTYHEEPDNGPFSAGYCDRVIDGVAGDCGRVHQDFEIFPRPSQHHCDPVVVTTDRFFDIKDLPQGIAVIPGQYLSHETPKIESELFDALAKIKLVVREGKLVIILAKNGNMPPAIPVVLAQEGSQIMIENLSVLAKEG